MPSNLERKAFIDAGVDALSLSPAEKTALKYQLSCIPSTYVDAETGEFSWTPAARVLAPELPAAPATTHTRWPL
jgi:hypothetical protein